MQETTTFSTIIRLTGGEYLARVHRENPTDPYIFLSENKKLPVDQIGADRYREVESWQHAYWYASANGKIIHKYASRVQAFENLDKHTIQRLDMGEADFYLYTAPERVYIGTRPGFMRHFPEQMLLWEQEQEENELRRQDQPKYENGARVDYWAGGVLYPSVVVRYLGKKAGHGKCYLVRAANPQETGDWKVMKGERFLSESLEQEQ